jgi:hypothetical protein
VSRLQPGKLHVRLIGGTTPDGPVSPRCYTLTHSDWSGDLYLSIGPQHDWEQIGGWYTRLMRDEVLAGWYQEGNAPALRVHCHVSGGLAFGSARFRDAILRRELPLALEAFRYGDKALYAAHPALDQAPIWVRFHAAQPRYDCIERWGVSADYVLGGG